MKRPRTRTFRQLMADAGIDSGSDLARKAGVTKACVSLISQGWRGTKRVRRALADALGVQPEDVRAASRVAHEEDGE